jgi:putative FmdB family regulatory protein
LPIYEYECTSCPSHFELKKGFYDNDPVCCPRCGAQARRRFSSVPIIFKGSGFYVTDSRGSQSSTLSSNSTGDTKSDTENKTSNPKEPVAAKNITDTKVSSPKDKSKYQNDKTGS